jgi:tRNA-binding EMAP/Myf-like protein
MDSIASNYERTQKMIKGKKFKAVIKFLPCKAVVLLSTGMILNLRKISFQIFIFILLCKTLNIWHFKISTIFFFFDKFKISTIFQTTNFSNSIKFWVKGLRFQFLYLFQPDSNFEIINKILVMADG